MIYKNSSVQLYTHCGAVLYGKNEDIFFFWKHMLYVFLQLDIIRFVRYYIMVVKKYLYIFRRKYGNS